MKLPPLYKGRMLNKILCLVLLVLTLILLGTAALFFLTGNEDIAAVFGILAAILGGFALIYGVMWFIWGRKEKKADQVLNTIFSSSQVPGTVTCQEFRLPKEWLKAAAGKRFFTILHWILAAMLGIFLFLGILLSVTGSLRTPLQLVYGLVFCLLIALPGSLVQWHLYRQYVRSIPEKIQLFPGRLVIDDTFYAAGEIREILMSSEHLMNQNSPAVFREMQVRTETSSTTYRIDYRVGTPDNGQPRWEAYDQLIEALSRWGTDNSVTVRIQFMD